MSIIESTIEAFPSFDEMPIFVTPTSLKLLQGIMSYGFVNPSPIQQKAIVPLANGRDIIAQAHSGTGKTGTFTIGVLSRIDFSVERPQAIIMAHTRELAEQTTAVVRSIGEKLKVKVVTCVGKTSSVNENMIAISSGCHVIVGTPGRIDDLLKRRAFRFADIKVAILDEADKLLSYNFVKQVGHILEVLDTAKDRTPLQIGIFSATLPPDIVSLSRDITRDPVVILVPQEDLSLEGIKQFKVEALDARNSFNYKADLIIRINEVKTIPQSIIYVNNIKSADQLQYYLNKHGGMETVVIHSGVSDTERHDTIRDFRIGRSRILISTDLLARGFDSQHVMLVINFDMPRVYRRVDDGEVCNLVVDQDKISEYLHRIGRSGRYGRKGVAINFITNPTEKTCLETIEKYYNVYSEDLPRDLEHIF